MFCHAELVQHLLSMKEFISYIYNQRPTDPDPSGDDLNLFLN